MSESRQQQHGSEGTEPRVAVVWKYGTCEYHKAPYVMIYSPVLDFTR